VVPESDGYAYDAVSGNENSVAVGDAGVGGGGFGGVAEMVGLRDVEDADEVVVESTPGEVSVSVSLPSDTSSSQESATFLFLGLMLDLVDVEGDAVLILRVLMALVTSFSEGVV